MQSTKKMPLFIITGASGVGKSTISEILFRKEEKYIVLESDLLWNDIYNTPENDYREYRKMWLKICASISQIGMPVVLCGCVTPKQFEYIEERTYFSEIYYLAIVCNENSLVSRMKNGRHIMDQTWINDSIAFNEWLKENYYLTNPKIRILDNTDFTLEETADIVDQWICERL